jgi:hypothetical protein
MYPCKIPAENKVLTSTTNKKWERDNLFKALRISGVGGEPQALLLEGLPQKLMPPGNWRICRRGHGEMEDRGISRSKNHEHVEIDSVCLAHDSMEETGKKCVQAPKTHLSSLKSR